jgi:hypothetical protein
LRREPLDRADGGHEPEGGPSLGRVGERDALVTGPGGPMDHDGLDAERLTDRRDGALTVSASPPAMF